MEDSATPALDAWNAKCRTSSQEQLARNLERLLQAADSNSGAMKDEIAEVCDTYQRIEHQKGNSIDE